MWTKVDNTDNERRSTNARWNQNGRGEGKRAQRRLDETSCPSARPHPAPIAPGVVSTDKHINVRAPPAIATAYPSRASADSRDCTKAGILDAVLRARSTAKTPAVRGT